MPSLVVRARDSKGADLVEVRIAIDGQVVAESSDGRAIPVDPGIHVVHLESRGQQAMDERVVVAEGERNRTLVLSFVNVATAPSSVTTEPRRAAIGAFIVGGLGIASIGVGAVFYGLGLSQRSNDTNGACATVEPGVSPSTSCEDERSSIRTKLIAGDVLTGIGVAAVVSAVVWAIVHYASGGHEKAPVSSFEYLPIPGGAISQASFAF